MQYQALNKKVMYHRLFRKGSIVQDQQTDLNSLPLLLRIVASPSQDDIRIGFLICKKTGKAFFRNKLRRILKACVQEQFNFIPPSSWILFDVSPKPLQISLKQFRFQAQCLLRQLPENMSVIC